jgi:hypothetical protein
VLPTIHPFITIDDGTLVIEKVPPYSELHPPELIITLKDPNDWNRLHLRDLGPNFVQSAPSSPLLWDLQDCLQHKHYIDKVPENVRAVLPCCRPPNLHCSRYLCHSGGFWPG